MRAVLVSSRRLLRIGLGLGLTLGVVLDLGGCGSQGTAPTLELSTTFADGRSCHDAGVVTIAYSWGDAAPLDFLCENTEPPGAVMVAGLPLAGDVDVLGLSAGGASLYRGTLAPADAVDVAGVTTIVLYPYAAR